MPYKQLFFILFFLLFTLSKLSAQESTPASLIPARPGLSPFPSRLDKNTLVLEGAYSLTREKATIGSDRINRLPVQLRYGILENMEVNLGFEYRSLQENTAGIDSTFSGLSATTVGAKFRIIEERGIYPRIEFQGTLKLPYFGEEKFIPLDVEPSFNLSFLHNINERFLFTYGFGMFWRGPDENGFYGVKATKWLNNSNAFFVEHYAYLRGNDKNEAHIAAGYILLAHRKFQLDTSIDLGKMKGRSFFGLNVGVSILLKD